MGEGTVSVDMQQSPLVRQAHGGFGRITTEELQVTDAETVSDVLAALDDEGCRAIMDATREEALAAGEVAETCDLALSTAYRKLDELTETGLLRERTRLATDGKHKSEYVLAVSDVSVRVGGDDGTALTVTLREETTNQAFSGELSAAGD